MKKPSSRNKPKTLIDHSKVVFTQTPIILGRRPESAVKDNTTVTNTAAVPLIKKEVKPDKNIILKKREVSLSSSSSTLSTPPAEVEYKPKNIVSPLNFIKNAVSSSPLQPQAPVKLIDGEFTKVEDLIVDSAGYLMYSNTIVDKRLKKPLKKHLRLGNKSGCFIIGVVGRGFVGKSFLVDYLCTGVFSDSKLNQTKSINLHHSNALFIDTPALHDNSPASIQTLLLLFSVCHLVVVVSDKFVDDALCDLITKVERIKLDENTVNEEMFLPSIVYVVNKLLPNDFTQANLNITQNHLPKNSIFKSRKQYIQHLPEDLLGPLTATADTNIFFLPRIKTRNRNTLMQGPYTPYHYLESLFLKFKHQLYEIPRYPLRKEDIEVIKMFQISESDWFKSFTRIAEGLCFDQPAPRAENHIEVKINGIKKRTTEESKTREAVRIRQASPRKSPPLPSTKTKSRTIDEDFDRSAITTSSSSSSSPAPPQRKLFDDGSGVVRDKKGRRRYGGSRRDDR